jgi:hypothetical protein
MEIIKIAIEAAFIVWAVYIFISSGDDRNDSTKEKE